MLLDDPGAAAHRHQRGLDADRVIADAGVPGVGKRRRQVNVAILAGVFGDAVEITRVLRGEGDAWLIPEPERHERFLARVKDPLTERKVLRGTAGDFVAG